MIDLTLFELRCLKAGFHMKMNLRFGGTFQGSLLDVTRQMNRDSKKIGGIPAVFLKLMRTSSQACIFSWFIIFLQTDITEANSACEF